jgi:hypothetical protein
MFRNSGGVGRRGIPDGGTVTYHPWERNETLRWAPRQMVLVNVANILVRHDPKRGEFGRRCPELAVLTVPYIPEYLYTKIRFSTPGALHTL